MDFIDVVLNTILLQLFVESIKCSAQHSHETRRLSCTPLLSIGSNNEVHPIDACPIKICERFWSDPKISTIPIPCTVVVELYIVKLSVNSSELRNIAVKTQSASIGTALYAVQVSGNFHLHCYECSMSWTIDLLHWAASDAVQTQRNYYTYCNLWSSKLVILYRWTTQHAVSVQ